MPYPTRARYAADLLRDAKTASQDATRRDAESKATRLEVGLDTSSGQDRVGRLKAFYFKWCPFEGFLLRNVKGVFQGLPKAFFKAFLSLFKGFPKALLSFV